MREQVLVIAAQQRDLEAAPSLRIPVEPIMYARSQTPRPMRQLAQSMIRNVAPGTVG